MSDANGTSETNAQRAMRLAGEQAMKPYDAKASAAHAAWGRMAVANDEGVICIRCEQSTFTHLNEVCHPCFLKANGVNQEPEAESAPSEEAAPSCNFCGRGAKTIVEAGGSLVQGSGAFICNSCACATAGCIGARSASEARGMMAQSSMQAEAVKQTSDMMKRAGESQDAGEALSLSQAAEALAHIARGQ